MSRGILAIWNDVDPARDGEYEHWYMRQHLPERVGIEGFRTGRRFERVEGEPRFFTFYEVDSPEVLASSAYLTRLSDPTPETLAIMPHFRAMSRTVCTEVRRQGPMDGGVVLSVRIDGREPLPLPAPDALDAMLAPLYDPAGVCGLRLWRAVPALQTGGTRESELRGGPDATIAGAVVIETARLEDAQGLRDGPALDRLLEAVGGSGKATTGIYRLLCRLEHEALQT